MGHAALTYTFSSFTCVDVYVYMYMNADMYVDMNADMNVDMNESHLSSHIMCAGQQICAVRCFWLITIMADSRGMQAQ